MTKFFTWIETTYAQHGWVAALVIGLAIVVTLLGTAYVLGIGTSDLGRWLDSF